MPIYRVVHDACEYLCRAYLGNTVLPSCYRKHSSRLLSTKSFRLAPTYIHIHILHKTNLEQLYFKVHKPHLASCHLYTTFTHNKFPITTSKMAGPTQEELRALHSIFLDRTTKPDEFATSKLANLSLASASPVGISMAPDVNQGMSTSILFTIWPTSIRRSTILLS